MEQYNQCPHRLKRKLSLPNLYEDVASGKRAALGLGFAEDAARSQRTVDPEFRGKH